MKALGLITEYNPFHNGHLYHLKASKDCTGSELTIAVMSGHFLQRGVPALTDKWQRAEMAIRSGVDLVVELPVLYACASAEHFASGSVALLTALGVQGLCFGSEDGELAPLMATAKILAEESPTYTAALRIQLDKGLSFPDARERALHSLFPQDGPRMKLPNNILGIEYCKAILRQGSPMPPHTIRRTGAAYHSTEIHGDICSATAIRALIKGPETPQFGHVMPPEAAAIMDQAYHYGNIASEELLFPALQYLLRSMSEDRGLRVSDCDHGLWNRLVQAARTATSYDGLLQLTKTRHYTFTRIQRVLMAMLLGIDHDTRERLGLPRYIRVLGSSGVGRRYLKSNRKHFEIPVINNLSRHHSSDPLLEEMLSYDILATDIFSLALSNPQLRSSGKDWQIKSPYVGI